MLFETRGAREKSVSCNSYKLKIKRKSEDKNIKNKG